MSREEIYRLMGGYATGTLSEAQRKLLFEAALDDQELFDELARDQALKELLESPGVKERLLAGIEAAPERVWWKHPLPWAMAGAALSVSAGLLLLVWVGPSGSREVPVARNAVKKRPAPVASETPQAPPQLQNEPKVRAAQTGAGGGSTPKTTAEAAPAQPVAPFLQNEPTQSQVADNRAPGGPARDATETKVVGSLSAPAAAPPPSPAPAPLAAAAPPVPAARAAAAPATNTPASPVGRLAFDYSIYDGVLRVIPAADGYVIVRVTVHEDDRVLLRTSHVKGSSPVELRVPEGATWLLIALSPRPVAEEKTENLPAGVATRTEMSGSMEDPRPSLTSRLQVRIRLSGK